MNFRNNGVVEIGTVTGKPRWWLRLDGAVLFVASILLFAKTHETWWIYPVLLFVPDLFMIGYVRSTVVGAFLYNLGHSYLAPAAVAIYGLEAHHRFGLAIGLIWLGHVGLDRALGYGLKHDDGFGHTHLGHLARGGRTRSPTKTSP